MGRACVFSFCKVPYSVNCHDYHAWKFPGKLLPQGPSLFDWTQSLFSVKSLFPRSIVKNNQRRLLNTAAAWGCENTWDKNKLSKIFKWKAREWDVQRFIFLSINKILGIWKVICMYKGCVPAPSRASDVEETQSSRTDVKKNLLINLLRRYGATQGKLSWRSSGSSTAPKISSLLTRPVRDKGAFRMLRCKWQFTGSDNL